ncbi:uncharacterized protein LOC126253157 [Schistocerca nitens]|uniref:uncharacterized protein LOC126253157 n=1 Tax=Schistocerca nitens TaxID=7011 RepID=UPI002119905C|nr:uncharacterized protein LOC126253157 [Schistocerca nitens]
MFPPEMRRLGAAYSFLGGMIFLLYINKGCTFLNEVEENGVVRGQSCSKSQPIAVVQNEEALIRLSERFPGMESCFVMSPKGNWTFTDKPEKYEETSSQENVTFWGNFTAGDCGVRIRNVSMSDDGSWSLISIQTNGNYCESTEVELKYIAPEDKNVKVSAGSRLSWDSMVDGASYCSIKKPDGTPYYEMFAGYCKVDIDKAYYGDAGAWTVLLGFDGKMEEVEVTVNVEIEGTVWHGY